MTIRTAVISRNSKYRYHLRRTFDGNRGPIATFIMLNPSMADHLVDDPTIRKCMGFCATWGCAELSVVNLFAFRASNPAELREADDPVGPENRIHVRRAVANAVAQPSPGPVVCAWGLHGGFMAEDKIVLHWIAALCQPLCLGLTRQGHPRHPLYLPYTTKLMRFEQSGKSNCCARSTFKQTSLAGPSPHINL
jgi:hypothetical protein